MNDFIDSINQVYNISNTDTHNLIFGLLVAGYFLWLAIDSLKSDSKKDGQE